MGGVTNKIERGGLGKWQEEGVQNNRNLVRMMIYFTLKCNYSKEIKVYIF